MTFAASSPLGLSENRFTVTTGDGQVLLIHATADQVRDELQGLYGIRGYQWLKHVMIETFQGSQNVAFMANFWLLHILATGNPPTFGQ